jgi:hypothetical protein
MAVSYEPSTKEKTGAHKMSAAAAAILRAALENVALVEMAQESDKLAKESGTDDWPTLEELEQEYGVSG